MEHFEWTSEVSQTIAREVRYHRKRIGMTAQKLSDTCAELGHPIARQVLTNLETGRREAVTVAELLVLARALKTAPLLLVFPVGRERSVEPTAGVERGAWDTLKWASGQAAFPKPVDRERFETDHEKPEVDDWVAGCEPIHDYSREDRAVRAWKTHRARALELKHQALDATQPDGQRTQLLALAAEESDFADVARSDIQKLRVSMKKNGYVLRDLPVALDMPNEEEENK